MNRPSRQLTREDKAAIHKAAGLGLYLLIEGPAGKRTWKIYSKTTGKELGWFQTTTARYRVGGTDGVDNDWLKIFRLAATAS